MKIRPFELERWQSHHEHDVDVNLSDSGVHPLTASELVPDPDVRAALLDTRLGYTQTNGTEALRGGIAALFPGARADQVLVTTGGAEANFLAAWTLVDRDDEVIVVQPNYQQLWGIADSLGARCRGWKLRPDLDAGRWTLDLDELASMVSDRTKLIALCTPNNPTGAVIDEATLDAVVSIAARVGAWVLSDEVYCGAELDGSETASAWDRYDRVVVTGSLSKAYGLQGLRLGWMVCDAGLADAAWTRHDYTSIAPAALSDALATHALIPSVRARLIARGRAGLIQNRDTVARWIASRDDVRWIPPTAGAMAWMHLPGANTAALAERARVQESILIVPGEHYDQPGWIRVGFGVEPAQLEEGLIRLGRVLDDSSR